MTCSVEARVELEDFVLDVAVETSGQPLAIVGPNGSGKSTLLRIIAGAIRPDRGEIVVDGVPVFSSARGIDLAPQQRGVGYVPQGYGLFPHLSVLDNVAFGLRARGSDTARRAQDMLSELGLAALADRSPGTLSGGEQQRVALARALVIRPRILLLDEPLAALDVRARRETRRQLRELLEGADRATIVVTHDVRDAAALDADICVMEGGRIVQRGSVDDLTASPVNAFVEEFVGMR